MKTGKQSSNMKLIGAAIVVIVIIALAAVFISGSKGKSQGLATTSPITAVAPGQSTSIAQGSTTGQTTAPTTTAQQSATFNLESLAGQNISLSQFSQDMGILTYDKLPTLNETYNYKLNLAFTGGINLKENFTGTTNLQKYYNDSRLQTTSNVSGYVSSSTVIYNFTSHKEYVCSSPGGGSMSCIALNTSENIVNSTDGVGYFTGKISPNASIRGYYKNIKVSSAVYNGQPCTLVTGDLYTNATQTKSPPYGTAVINGMMSACISTQFNAWLNSSMIGSMVVTANGRSANASISYNENEVSIGTAVSPNITALPGNVVQG